MNCSSQIALNPVYLGAGLAAAVNTAITGILGINAPIYNLRLQCSYAIICLLLNVLCTAPWLLKELDLCMGPGTVEAGRC